MNLLGSKRSLFFIFTLNCVGKSQTIEGKLMNYEVRCSFLGCEVGFANIFIVQFCYVYPSERR